MVGRAVRSTCGRECYLASKGLPMSNRSTLGNATRRCNCPAFVEGRTRIYDPAQPHQSEEVRRLWHLVHVAERHRPRPCPHVLTHFHGCPRTTWNLVRDASELPDGCPPSSAPKDRSE